MASWVETSGVHMRRVYVQAYVASDHDTMPIVLASTLDPALGVPAAAPLLEAGAHERPRGQAHQRVLIRPTSVQARTVTYRGRGINVVVV